MATTRKTPDKATQADEPAKATTKKAEATYSDKAGQLAADTVAFVEDARDRLAELLDQVGEVQQTAPTPDEAAAADGVRRIPMSTGDVDRALQGLYAVAADLRQRTAS